MRASEISYEQSGEGSVSGNLVVTVCQHHGECEEGGRPETCQTAERQLCKRGVGVNRGPDLQQMTDPWDVLCSWFLALIGSSVSF